MPVRKTAAADNTRFTPAPELAAIIGSAPISKKKATSKVWDYIRKHNLQKPSDKRVIQRTGGSAVPPAVHDMSEAEVAAFVERHLR
jgi:upstream activation factor subunit UAF30